MALTLRNVFENALQLLDIERASNSPTYIRERVIGDINAAIQKIQASGRDYFIREQEEVSLVAGTARYTLAATVLHVLFPAKLSDGTPLREITTKGDFELFGQIFTGQTGVAEATGKPMGVFIDRTRQSGNDPVRITACFAPTPASAYTAQLDVSRLPAAYTLSQVTEPSPVIPIVHGFAESVLLPIVRWNVRTSHYFRRKDLLQSMEQEYLAALEQIGAVDPQIKKPGVSADVLEQAKANARSAASKAYRDTLANQ